MCPWFIWKYTPRCWEMAGWVSVVILGCRVLDWRFFLFLIGKSYFAFTFSFVSGLSVLGRPTPTLRSSKAWEQEKEGPLYVWNAESDEENQLTDVLQKISFFPYCRRWEYCYREQVISSDACLLQKILSMHVSPLTQPLFSGCFVTPQSSCSLLFWLRHLYSTLTF